MRLILAPMEGVVDYTMRQLLTSIGGYDLCVTEFIRVSNHILSERAFYKICPELKHGCQTLSGTPVRLQLLGQCPDILAQNAIVACQLGASGIDLNFGCPAKTVNKHKGGAVLLDYPETIGQIVKQVRDAVPENIPVSAKIRLGVDHSDNALDIAKQVEAAGADELFIHARTKKQGYKPPAYWHLIKEIKSQVSTNIVANGEVWTYQDYTKCQFESGCDDVMIGRGALANPELAKNIKLGISTKPDWPCVVEYLLFQHQTLADEKLNHPNYYPFRVKQWFSYLKLAYPEAVDCFDKIKRLKTSDAIIEQLKHYLK
ncbi:tRNA-dihydrouridine synthase [Catenovulum sp. SM1970]|uniref:tRNA-dihydrouridine synthase n=1 Tax=Marinifaba aquimaris TaxID=2741323 RepID=UPI001571EE53|nr:tRNA-dihydrouridine synthase [Marinifaba aquimaris]NTS75263.1 tRNA-dihydrouridine synthase [Marinifaba aquimaris]